MHANDPAPAAEHGSEAAAPGQYLSFMLSGETFATGIMAIREIIEYGNLTVVPMMPPAVCGVINLRGAVVPVIDLGLRFGRLPTVPGRRTCIVIVEVANGTGQRVLGIVVDAVNEVLEIARGQVERPPEFGARMRADFIAGMGKVDGRFVILVDVDRILPDCDPRESAARETRPEALAA